MRASTCHPDRPHYAKGRCHACYLRWVDHGRREPTDLATRRALCHPDRKYYARGMCANCYKTDYAARHDYMHQKVWKARNPEAHNAHRRKANRKYYAANKKKIQRRQMIWEWERRHGPVA